jgi:hypothetical protein
MPRLYWQGLRASIKASRANAYAVLRSEQSAAMRQALERARESIRGNPRSSKTAWDALRKRHNAERAALSGEVAREKQAARFQLITRQQQERISLQGRHRVEWQGFNRSCKAQETARGRAASVARRNTKSAFATVAPSPAEKQMRAQARKQAAQQNQARQSPRKPTGQRFKPDG